MADEKVLGPENQGDDTPAIDVLQDYLPKQAQLNDYSGANLGPGISRNMPLPAGLTQGANLAPPPAAPAVGPAGTPSDAVDDMAKMYFKHLLDRQPPAPAAAAPAPGGFADKLRGALSGFQSSLGDAAAATENLPSGVGGLGGIERTFRARSERQAGEKQRSFENQQALNREKRENALNNIQMSIHELQLQKAKKELQDDLYASNEVASKAREEGGFDVEHGVSESEISRRMDSFKGPNNEHYTDLYDLMPIRRTEINGKPETQFNVVTKKAGNIVPTDEERSFIRDNGGPDLTEGTAVPNNSLVAMRLAAQRTNTGRQMIEDATGKQLSTEKAKQLNADLQSSVVQHAMSTNLEDPISGLMDAKQSADAHVQQFSQLLQAAQAHGDPAAIQEAQQHLAQVQREKKSLDNVFTFGITKEDLENHRKYLEDVEKKRHNIAEEGIAKTKAAADTPEAAQSRAQDLVEGDMDPSQLSKRSKNYNAVLDEAKKYSQAKYGKPFDIAQAQTDYKYANQKSTKDTLNMVNSITDPGGSLEIAETAAKKLPAMDEQTLNKVFNLAGGEFGSAAITNFHTAMLGLADEYAQVMGKGQTTDTGRQQALDLLKDSYSKGQFAGAKDIILRDLTARQRSTIGGNRYLQREYKPLQAALTQQTVAAPPKGFEGKIGVEAGEGTNRKTHYFNTQAEADNFKKLLAGNQ